MTVFFAYSPAVLSLFFTLKTLQLLEASDSGLNLFGATKPLFWQILLFPFLLQIFFILFVFILRILLPQLKPGVYLVGFNKGFMAWYFHSMLTRSARTFGIHYLLHCTATFRWLYWRALGAKVPFNMSTSYKITLHDAPVITIGEGTTLAEDTELSGHLVRGDKVLVAAVKIGKGVFIGRKTYIGPRTRIGDHAWIGMNNTLSGQVIAEKEVIKSLGLSDS